MAAEAVVSVVLQKLTDILEEESIIHNNVIVHQMEEIRKLLQKMRDLLLIHTKDGPEENLHFLYEVEDEVEKFTIGVAWQRNRLGFLMKYAFFFNNLNACLKLRRKMKKITTQIQRQNGYKPLGIVEGSHGPFYSDATSDASDADLVRDKEGERELLHQNHFTNSWSAMREHNGEGVQRGKKLTFSYSNNEEQMQIVGFIEERLQYPKQMSSFSYKEEELGIFGFKDDVDALVKRLTEEDEPVVVSIVGEGGIGKTTLARAIYRRRDIKQRFKCRAWISVLKEYTTGDILRTLLKGLDNFKEKKDVISDEQAMKWRLFECLKDKRYLVVLDGVRTPNIWEDIKDSFPDKKNGSKLILTSSEKCATTKTGIISRYLKRLSEEDSWNMFLKKAGIEESDALIPETLKQKILEICSGLPLHIVLVAGLLSMKKINSWSRVLSFGQSSADVLPLCYNNLTVHLKTCLLYLVLFPKDFDIPVRRLLRLWLAEGFVKQRSTKSFPEDTVQQYFEDLVNRSMIQISKLRSDNSPRRCRLLGVLHDYLLPKAQDIGLFYIYRDLINREEDVVAGPFGVRRMVDFVGFKGGTQQTQSKSLLHNSSHMRSYLSFNFQKKDTPAKEVGSFLGKIIDNGFGLLRVLDLEGVYKPSLPEKLGTLYHLRYLGLRWTFLDSLPQSVGDLPYLQTLDVKHTYIDELPDSFWRLKNLRHLNLNDIRLDMQLHSSLTLLTLWGLFLDKKIFVQKGLDKLLDLRELGITFHLSSSQNDLMDWIAKLTALQSLRLRSKDDMGGPSKLILKPMSNLGQLSHLYLLGNLERLPDQNEFPPTMKVLTLSLSRLEEDPMRTLGQLPSLTVLRLLGSSYLGKEMVCHRGGFGKLRVLKLWMLKEFERWDVEEESMQSLKQLNIRCCQKLKNIPTRLLQQRTLEELVLTDMPNEFTAQVEGSKSLDTSLIVNYR